MKWKNVFERAAWTAVQAFTSTFVVVSFFNKDEVVTAAASAASAAGAAVLSFIKTVAQDRLSKLGDSVDA